MLKGQNKYPHRGSWCNYRNSYRNSLWCSYRNRGQAYWSWNRGTPKINGQHFWSTTVYSVIFFTKNIWNPQMTRWPFCWGGKDRYYGLGSLASAGKCSWWWEVTQVHHSNWEADRLAAIVQTSQLFASKCQTFRLLPYVLLPPSDQIFLWNTKIREI